MRPLRCCILAVVSGPNQATADKASIPEQLAESRTWASARGWPVTHEVVIPGHSRNYVYLDELVADCPEYGQLLRLIRADAIDLVIVRHYDRLFRTQELQSAIMAVCREHRVQVYSLNQPVEPQDPDTLKVKAIDKLVLAVHGFTAEAENEIRMERMRVGLQARVARGARGCTARRPYGYVFEGETMVPHPDEAPWVEHIFQRRAEGWPLLRIAKRLTALGVPTMRGAAEWSYPTVRDILSNKHYLGLTKWQGRTMPGQHEPLIDRALWDAAQHAAARQPRLASPRLRPLSRLCRCAFCGTTMIHVPPSRSRSGHVTLVCNAYLKSPAGARECRYRPWHAPEVEAYVMERVGAILSAPEAHMARREAQGADQVQAEIARLDGLLKAREAERERLVRAYRADVLEFEELEVATKEVKAAQRHLEQEREALAGRAAQAERIADELNQLQGTHLAALNVEALRAVYLKFIDRVLLGEVEDGPEIVWR